MGFLDTFRGRESTTQTGGGVYKENQNEKPLTDGQRPDEAETPISDGSHQGDMFDDAKELAHNPDTVTSDAELGQQKAEAAALVWGRPALVGIYAW